MYTLFKENVVWWNFLIMVMREPYNDTSKTVLFIHFATALLTSVIK
jgi:hypothetical protein